MDKKLYIRPTRAEIMRYQKRTDRYRRRDLLEELAAIEKRMTERGEELETFTFN